MRTLAIGDIHGCRASLEALAAYAGFTSDDTIVTLGDYVDRGADSKGVIDWLLQWRQHGKLVSLRGNHEIMMLEARTSRAALTRWLTFGGDAALDSYGKSFADVPDAHWHFMETSKPYFETGTHIFVHANIKPQVPMDKQTIDTLCWEPFGKPKPHRSGKVMVCGHTSQTSGVPLTVGRAICIDTFAHGGGWLTCLDVESGNYWQTNEQGERQTGNLSEQLN